MTTVTITCPISWWERCQWIYKNCTDPVDRTNWAMWQIGQGDIYFEVEDQDAVWFTLKWP